MALKYIQRNLFHLKLSKMKNECFMFLIKYIIFVEICG